MKFDFAKVLVLVLVAGIAAGAVWWFAGTINNERSFTLVKHRPAVAHQTTWQGKLVAGGVECQRFQAQDGTFYTIARTDLLSGLKTGDRIAVTGTVANMSFCQQDTTITPTLILRGK